MLEKITNISPNSDYKKSTGNPKYYKKTNSYSYVSNSINDSILISPATALLATYGWKLIKINNQTDKIHIVFELNGFEFDSTIYLNELSKFRTIEYKIKKGIEGYAAEITVLIILITHIKSDLTEIETEKNLDALNEFFEQFKSISVKRPNIITDKLTIDSLSRDFIISLNKEFNYINSCLIKFLNKYASINLNIHHSQSDENRGVKDGIIIKSIHIS